MTKIYLYGALRKHCDNLPFVEMHAPTVKMAVQALASRFGEGVKDIIQNNNWQITKKKYNKNKDTSIGEEDIVEKHLSDSLHFYPIIEGAGKTGKIIAGVVLIVVGFIINWFSYGSMTAVGNNLILSGVGMILSGLFTPSMPNARNEADNRASFVFNQAVNTIEQGGPVNLVYGRFKTGSTVVSAGIDAEKLMTYNSPTTGNSAPDSTFWSRALDDTP